MTENKLLWPVKDLLTETRNGKINKNNVSKQWVGPAFPNNLWLINYWEKEVLENRGIYGKS
jgi:hypothetical protein